jgi:cytochrome c oxidase subunit 4
MTTTTVSDAAEHEVDETVHDHPSDLKYVKIALILAIITAAEVSTYFIKDASTTFLVALLFPMMIVKFAVVVAYFMHLKYDNPIFRRVFVFGLVLAVCVFTIVFFTFSFFDESYLKYLKG